MKADREMKVNGNHIEEFYWAGRLVVYVNNRKFEGMYEEAVKQYSEQEVE